MKTETIETGSHPTEGGRTDTTPVQADEKRVKPPPPQLQHCRARISNLPKPRSVLLLLVYCGALLFSPTLPVAICGWEFSLPNLLAASHETFSSGIDGGTGSALRRWRYDHASSTQSGSTSPFSQSDNAGLPTATAMQPASSPARESMAAAMVPVVLWAVATAPACVAGVAPITSLAFPRPSTSFPCSFRRRFAVILMYLVDRNGESFRELEKDLCCYEMSSCATYLVQVNLRS